MISFLKDNDNSINAHFTLTGDLRHSNFSLATRVATGVARQLGVSIKGVAEGVEALGPKVWRAQAEPLVRSAQCLRVYSAEIKWGPQRRTVRRVGAALIESLYDSEIQKWKDAVPPPLVAHFPIRGRAPAAQVPRPFVSIF